MLRDSLFSIVSINHEEQTITASLRLDAKNEIFAGHFPGQPVLPGACMLQILKEVLEDTLNAPLIFQKAGMMKFLSMIDPGVDELLEMKIAYNGDNLLNVTASLSAADRICFKFKGEFLRQRRTE